MLHVFTEHFSRSKISPTKQHLKACSKGPQEAAALTAQMSPKMDLLQQASVWISHLAHAYSCATLWPSSSELEMLFQMLGPNGHFLNSQGKPSSFGNKFKLFLYFPLLSLLWDAAPKRCGLPSRQRACKKGKTEAKPAQEGPGSGIQR